MSSIVRAANTIGARGGVAFGNFLLPLLVANYYGLKILGLFVTVLSVVTFLHLILKFGMDKVLMREVSKLDGIRSYVELSLIFFIVILIILVLIALISKYYFNFDYEEYTIYIILTSIPFTILFLNSSITQALGKPDLGMVFNPGLISLIMCFLLYFFSDYITLDSLLEIYSLLLWFLMLISFFIVYLFLKPFKSKKIRNFEKLNFFKSSFIFFTISLFIYSQQISLTFTLNSFESLDMVGLIRYVEKISLLFTFPLMVIVAIFSPKFSFHFHNKNHILLKNEFFISLKYCFIFGLLFSLILILAWFYYGEKLSTEYEGIIVYAIPFVLAQLINLITGPSDILLGMVNKEKLLLRLTVLSGTISIVLFYLALEFLSLIYAICLLNLVYVTRNILQFMYALKFLGKL